MKQRWVVVARRAHTTCLPHLNMPVGDHLHVQALHVGGRGAPGVGCGVVLAVPQ